MRGNLDVFVIICKTWSDGCASRKVKGPLKTLGLIDWGLRMSTVNLITICPVIVDIHCWMTGRLIHQLQSYALLHYYFYKQ